MNNKSNQLGAGVLLSYLGQAIQILLTLFYTPVMRRLLGQSEYGVYEIVVGVVGMLSLLTLGFCQSYIKHYSDCRVKEDGEREYGMKYADFDLFFKVEDGEVTVTRVEKSFREVF